MHKWGICQQTAKTKKKLEKTCWKSKIINVKCAVENKGDSCVGCAVRLSEHQLVLF